MKLKELVRKVYGVTHYSLCVNDKEVYYGLRTGINFADYDKYEVVDFSPISRTKLLINMEGAEDND